MQAAPLKEICRYNAVKYVAFGRIDEKRKFNRTKRDGYVAEGHVQ